MRGKLLVILLLLAGALLGALAVLGVAATIACHRFEARYAAEEAELRRQGLAGRTAPGSTPAEVRDLPATVRRYLEVTDAARRPPLRLATLRQTGSLRAAADQAWMPFESEQLYATEPPGFVWFARARVAPGVHILARDAFVGGRGSMIIRLLGLVSLADATGPELDLGAGLRYWGEIIAFPETVRSPYLTWEHVSDRQARVHIRQGELEMTATVDFDEAGYPVAVHAPRYRDVAGRSVLTPWSGHSRDWRLLDGRMFPTSWESVWHLPEGDLVAVRMRVTHVRTE